MITGQFSDAYFPIMDGVTLTVKSYAVELSRILGPAFVITAAVPGCKESWHPGIYRYCSLPLPGRPPYRLGLAQVDWSLARELREVRFDLVHAHSPFCAGRLALRIARRRGIPIVATFHSKYRDKFENALPFTRLVDWEIGRIVDFFESVDQVWVPTEASLETLREYGYRGSVEVVGHGIDFEPCADKESLRFAGEQLLEVGPEDFLFLYVGEQAWEKNLALLLHSLALLKAAGQRFRTAFVGGGYAARALKALADRLGLGRDTVFTGVLRDRALLSACYARADCFLFPSLYDTCGLVVKEAAAFGVPSVLMRGSAAAEEIEDGSNGFVAENSARAYADKLRWLLGDRARMARAGEGARLSLARSWTDVAEEVRDRYLRLAGGVRPVGNFASRAAVALK